MLLPCSKGRFVSSRVAAPEERRASIGLCNGLSTLCAWFRAATCSTHPVTRCCRALLDAALGMFWGSPAFRDTDGLQSNSSSWVCTQQLRREEVSVVWRQLPSNGPSCHTSEPKVSSPCPFCQVKAVSPCSDPFPSFLVGLLQVS